MHNSPSHTLLRAMVAVAVVLTCSLGAADAHASIVGQTGTNFTLYAKADRITTPDGGSILFWGFTTGDRAQYPGPTFVVNQGETVTISVTNQLPVSAGQRVSLIFPGQQTVTAVCTSQATVPCVQGPLALEAAQGGTVTYQFTASRAGTFHYSSGTTPDLQIEMGLAGALIVRPAGYVPAVAGQAYNTSESAYDREYLFFLSEMDSHIHDLVEQQGVEAVFRTKMLSDYYPNYWFLNGRNAPDTMADDGGDRFPTQPYGSLVRMHPGERVLMRVIGGGHDMHPFHHHGNHARVIAVDGHLLQSAGVVPSTSIDLAHDVFTIQSIPGQTVDAIFEWSAKDIGWDIYGTEAEFAHDCNGRSVASAQLLRSTDRANAYFASRDGTTGEYCADHGKRLPVVLPDFLSTDFGGFWSGSPYLGVLSLLPPGQGGLNPDAGYSYMWHSHTEKEITNFDIFPGGMMTMLIVVPVTVTITPVP